MPRNLHYEPSKTDLILRKYDDLQERLFHLSGPINNIHHYNSSDNESPNRCSSVCAYNNGYIVEDESSSILLDNYETMEPEEILRLKWLDKSPRMSRIREHRQKRLVNKLEQFELWDMEQEQKQRQHEMAREQHYNNIVERLKCQEFCVNAMRKRHESDLETTRDLEAYTNDHLFVDAMDDPKINLQGPITQYRKFEAEMDQKVRSLQNDLDLINPRFRIEQAILPRLERTIENFAVEPQIFTRQGKRVLRKPQLMNDDISTTSYTKNSKSSNKTTTNGDQFALNHYVARPLSKSSHRRQQGDSQLVNCVKTKDRTSLKPIIHANSDDSIRSMSKLKYTNNRSVNFIDEIDFN